MTGVTDPLDKEARKALKLSQARKDALMLGGNSAKDGREYVEEHPQVAKPDEPFDILTATEKLKAQLVRWNPRSKRKAVEAEAVAVTFRGQ